MKCHLEDLKNLELDLSTGGIIFLNGDLGSGKTTFTKHILQDQLGVSESITSPTYTYYNKYGDNIYHFDLYRLSNYDEFFAIGGEEILDSGAICFIEWPDVLRGTYEPDIEVFLDKSEDELSRNIDIQYKK